MCEHFGQTAGSVRHATRSNPPGKHQALQECHGHPPPQGPTGRCPGPLAPKEPRRRPCHPCRLRRVPQGNRPARDPSSSRVQDAVQFQSRRQHPKQGPAWLQDWFCREIGTFASGRAGQHPGCRQGIQQNVAVRAPPTPRRTTARDPCPRRRSPAACLPWPW